MEQAANAAAADGNDSVVEVIRQLQQSGLNNLEDIITKSIESSQFAVRGSAASGEVMLRAEWKFISPDYIYEGGGSGTRLW